LGYTFSFHCSLLIIQKYIQNIFVVLRLCPLIIMRTQSVEGFVFEFWTKIHSKEFSIIFTIEQIDLVDAMSLLSIGISTD
jgi:hypothetical protein